MALTARIQRNQIANLSGGNRQNHADSDRHRHYFKMSEAWSLTGQFAGMSEASRDERLRRFASIVVRNSMHRIGAVMPTDSYAGTSKGYGPKQLDSEYFVCALRTLRDMLFIGQNSQLAERINFVFDRQQKKEFQLEQIRRQIAGGNFFASDQRKYLGRMDFEDDASMLPLQAADMMVWHIRKGKDYGRKKSSCIHDKLMALDGHVHYFKRKEMELNAAQMMVGWEKRGASLLDMLKLHRGEAGTR